MTGELTLFVLRLAFLAVLWIFVFSIIYALRSDLFGTRASEYQRGLEQSRQQTFGAAVDTGVPVGAGVGAGVGASAGSGAGPGPSASGRAGAPGDDLPTQAMAAPAAAAAPRPRPVVTNPNVSDRRERTTGGTPVQDPRAAGPTTLVITSGPRRGEQVQLDGRPLSIGRHPDSDLVIADDYSSTHHARLVPAGSGWHLQDLGSTNGTFVDGRRIGSSVELAPGQSVRIGTTTFELRR